MNLTARLRRPGGEEEADPAYAARGCWSVGLASAET